MAIRSASDRDSRSRHDQGVAGPQVVQASGHLGPVGVLAGQLVGEHAEAARLGQGVLLAVQQLAGGADPGVADQRAGPDGRLGGQKVVRDFGGTGVGCGHTRDCRRNGPAELLDTPGFATPFTTIIGRRGARSGAH